MTVPALSPPAPCVKDTGGIFHKKLVADSFDGELTPTNTQKQIFGITMQVVLYTIHLQK